MIGNITRKIKDQHGAVQIVEATFVFPVMFIILFFLIYMGNAFYEKAQVESIVQRNAIEGAAYCADPMLQVIKKNNGAVPTSAKNDPGIAPYRYIFGGMKDVENQIATAVKSEINGNTTSLFKTMNPSLKRCEVDFNSYVVYSTFSVEVEYDIQFPIKFMGESTPPVLTIVTRADVPVDDTAEFIRNADMVVDLFSQTSFGQKVSECFQKINDVLNNFAKK